MYDKENMSSVEKGNSKPEEEKKTILVNGKLMLVDI